MFSASKVRTDTTWKTVVYMFKRFARKREAMEERINTAEGKLIRPLFTQPVQVKEALLLNSSLSYFETTPFLVHPLPSSARRFCDKTCASAGRSGEKVNCPKGAREAGLGHRPLLLCAHIRFETIPFLQYLFRTSGQSSPCAYAADDDTSLILRRRKRSFHPQLLPR